jgi:hypothetical protein
MERIEVRLHGGPRHLPEHLRQQFVPHLQEPVKIPLGAGYEHFEYSGSDDGTVPRYVWTYRTNIAE